MARAVDVHEAEAATAMGSNQGMNRQSVVPVAARGISVVSDAVMFGVVRQVTAS